MTRDEMKTIELANELAINTARLKAENESLERENKFLKELLFKFLPNISIKVPEEKE
jgi:hypothetical protein